jgi:ABC-type multidrug transport system ATPase subunit
MRLKITHDLIRRLLLVLGLLLQETFTKITNGIVLEGVSKTFQGRSLFGNYENAAIKGVSADISDPLVAFIGPSKAGKSTLAKCIADRSYISSGQIHYPTVSNTAVVAYLDHLYSMKYDRTQKCDSLIQPLATIGNPECIRIKECILECIGSELKNQRVQDVLESQRALFEVTHCLLSIPDLQSSPVLILDEYLDKMASSVRKRFLANLQRLAEQNDVHLQTIVITHSRKTLEDCDCTTYLFQKGRLFNYNRDFRKLRLPGAYSFIE